MKKILSILFVLSLLLSLCACSDKDKAAQANHAQSSGSAPLYPGLKVPPDNEQPKAEAIPEDPIEYLTQECVQALFSADIATVFDKVHPSVMEYYMELGQINDQQYEIMISNYNDRLQSSVDRLNSSCDQWEVSSSVIKESSMTPDYLTTLNNNYAPINLIVESGMIVHVQIHVTADGREFVLPESARLCFVRIADHWYLDMSATSF